MSMKKRFESVEALVEALRSQRIIQGDEAAARALSERGELVEFKPGELLIEQGASDRDVFFLLAGETKIVVNGSPLYARGKDSTVGEMSAVNAQILRSSTIEATEATEATVAWKVGHEQLEAAGLAYPRLWKLLASDLASRLEQRNALVPRSNAKPRVFIISSAEALNVAENIRLGLEREAATIEIWSDEQIFPVGSYPLDALAKEVEEADFAIAIAQPDDLVRSRDKRSSTPRDNVIFELGFFMSKLGRARTLLLVPRGNDVRLPSDFKGLTPLEYKEPSQTEKISTALGPTVTRIKAAMRDLGVRRGADSR